MSADEGLRAELEACEAERRAALAADDMGRLARLMREDLVHVHTTGIVHDKSDVLAHSGKTLRFFDVIRGPLTIRRLGPDAAVMTGTMTNTVSRRGLDEVVRIESFVTQIWVRGEAGWQVASFQATRLPQEPS